MAQALKCSHCGAPLPDTQASTLRCPFCGTTNRLNPTVGQTQVREAVRQILDERSRPVQRQQPAPQNKHVAPVAIIAGAVVMFMVTGIVGAVLTRTAAPPRPVHVPKPVVVPVVVTAPIPQKPPAPPPPKPWGPLSAVTADERGDLLAVFGGKLLMKLDPATMTPRWQSPFSRGSGNYLIIIPRGDYIAIVTDSVAAFFEAASGAKVNEFKYRNGGILERACGAGKTQVLVDVLGAQGLMRFDAATGLRATSGPSCELRDKLSCPVTQYCSWSRVQTSTHDCKYMVRVGKNVFRSCETEDGQQRKVFVASGTNKWESPANESVENYFGVVDDTLIIGGYRAVVALNPETGDERWRKQTESTAVLAVGSTLYFGAEGTLVSANARTGEELSRLELRD